MLPSDSIIAGTWAPFLALNTEFRALYIDGPFNVDGPLDSTKLFEQLRPDYFLHSDVASSFESMRTIAEKKNVSLGASVLKTRYAGKEVILYPILYHEKQ